jgi:hypothetical protein
MLNVLTHTSLTPAGTSHIHGVAMLADFHVSQWTARKIDKRESDKVKAANKVTDDKAAHVSKKLVKSSELEAIATLVGKARAWHKLMTSPWANEGARILSVAHFTTYHEGTRDEQGAVIEHGMEWYESEFERLKPLFVAAYPEVRDNAQYVLGDLFDINDYPQASRIADKFRWNARIMPIPNAADFRVDVGDEQVARIQAGIEATLTERVSLATADCFERAFVPLAKLVEHLDAYRPELTGAAKGTFRDTATQNIADVVALLPGLNITGDKRVTDLCQSLADLIKPGPQAMRDDSRLRADTVAKAKAMVEAVSDLMA